VRLATLRREGGSAACVVRGGEAAVVAGYADVGALLRDGLDAARAATRFEPFEEADLLRPVLAPGAVVCVGMNYGAHVAEMGHEPPAHPTWFSKLPRALTDPGADVVVATERVDYEGELAVVIGAGGSIGGYTILNDVSMRDYQNRTTQFFAGKTWQRSTPLGPVVVTPDELGELAALELRTEVNGELRQRGSLGDLVFGVEALLADLGRIVELEPGDVIATGTPSGVGHAMKPPRYLAAGDVVAITVDGIGTLRNRFVAAGGRPGTAAAPRASS
jgi:acylpyruvate hydrolase